VTIALFKGFIAGSAILTVYFLLVSAISGPTFALSQFVRFWYFFLALSAGFGFQVGLYQRLKERLREKDDGKRVVAATGGTTTIAMVSCCSHYLVNVLPILGAVGIVTLISQYQVELFWVGIVANLFGSLYLISRLRKISIS